MTTTPSPASPLRFAFYGRCARDDRGDSIALAYQYEACRRVLAAHRIVAVFYDIATPTSGPTPDRLPLVTNSRPRDGGIAELLSEAAAPTRRFDHVITASLDRLSRRAPVAALLHHFAVRRVGVLYADDNLAYQLAHLNPVDALRERPWRLGILGLGGASGDDRRGDAAASARRPARGSWARVPAARDARPRTLEGGCR